MEYTSIVTEPSQLRSVLRDAGLRATAPRLTVMQYLATTRTPQSHAEVADQLALKGLDRATVYRNLTDLTEVGLLRRSDHGDHVWRFELAKSEPTHVLSEHPHFVCGNCGAVACLPSDAVRIQAARGTPRALKHKGVSIQVRGLCDACS